MSERKKVFIIKYVVVAAISCSILVLTIMISHSMAPDKHIDIDDVLSEGIVFCMALIMFLLVQRLSSDLRIYLPLSIGFGLYYISAGMDILEEFYKLQGFSAAIENRASVVGMVLATLGLYLWVKDKLKSEKMLAYSNRQLQKEIAQRKRAEKRKTHLLAKLKSTNEELKDFAYIVSHDLKAPLRGIQSLAEWILSDHKNRLCKDGQEQLILLNRRVERMHNLIDGILQYSRVGRIKEEKVEVDLNQLVSEIIDSIAPPENITVKVKGPLPSIVCEKTQTAQIFQNLMSNAVKYMDKPKGKIEIGCIAENGFWTFKVADNGPGIDKRYFNKIFQIFQTLAPRDEIESTGIGLALVKKMVETNGGRIWIESKVGKGSTFFFRLPRK